MSTMREQQQSQKKGILNNESVGRTSVMSEVGLRPNNLKEKKWYTSKGGLDEECKLISRAPTPNIIVARTSAHRHYQSAIETMRSLESVHAVMLRRSEWSRLSFLRSPTVFQETSVETRACQRWCSRSHAIRRRFRLNLSELRRTWTMFLLEATDTLHFCLDGNLCDEDAPRDLASGGGAKRENRS
jgi:hypothetical protein